MSTNTNHLGLVKTDFDRLYSGAEQIKIWPRVAQILLLFTLGFAGPLTAVLYIVTKSFLAMIPGLLLCGVSVYAQVRCVRLERWFYPLLNQKLEEVPKVLLDHAGSLYDGGGVVSKIAAIECHYAHVVGDCPLCGAK